MESDSNSVLLSLVVPTYNERHNFVPLIQRITFTLETIIDEFEIIVVDDDSPDGTWRLAEEMAKENVHLKIIRRLDEKGLATAVVAGWEVARGKILGVIDADLQHPPETLRELIASFLNTNADIVVASRHVEVV